MIGLQARDVKVGYVNGKWCIVLKQDETHVVESGGPEGFPTEDDASEYLGTAYDDCD